MTPPDVDNLVDFHVASQDAVPMKPACMTESEWAGWQEPIRGRRPVGYPCLDCPVAFYHEQRSAGTCDGYPRHHGGRRPTTTASGATERRRQSWREAARRMRARRRVTA